MKLRNKKTGEIINVDFVYPETAESFCPNFKLADFNELFEDYEEPKEYYAIDLQGDIIRWARHSWDEQTTNKIKAIGNYFETKEEAEKAVEKLKAWKRLKDKGFRFGHWVTVREKKCGKVEFKCDDIRLGFDEAQKFYNDITLLFGGKE